MVTDRQIQILMKLINNEQSLSLAMMPLRGTLKCKSLTV